MWLRVLRGAVRRSEGVSPRRAFRGQTICMYDHTDRPKFNWQHYTYVVQRRPTSTQTVPIAHTADVFILFCHFASVSDDCQGTAGRVGGCTGKSLFYFRPSLDVRLPDLDPGPRKQNFSFFPFFWAVRASERDRDDHARMIAYTCTCASPTPRG